MDLSNFVTYDEEESLLLSIAKSNLDIVENTLFKPQETLEFKMTRQKESFSFDIPLELPEKWMMGVTSLEAYNTVYNITEKNNKFEIRLTLQEVEPLNVDTRLVKNVNDYFIKFHETTTQASYIEYVEKINKLMVDSYSKNKKLSNFDSNELKKVIKDFYLKAKFHTLDTQQNSVNIPEFETVYFEVQLPPGAYELVDINNTIKQIISDSDFDIELNIEADTISLKSVLKTSNPIYFNSELIKLLGFTKDFYLHGTHKSEKPVMITTTDKVHLKCDCVDGSIVNGIREQNLFCFNLSAPPGYKIIEEPNTILYKKINKTRLDKIQSFLEDNNHNPVDFNSETLPFTIQIVKV